MDKFLENVMNFINENTTLLIIICVFLIFVLVGYLIDNSIKTRKIEREMLRDDNDINSMGNISQTSTVINTPQSLTPEIQFDTPAVEPVEPTSDEPVVEEPVNNEITVSPEVNDLLLRDFTSNGDKTVEVEQPAPVKVDPVVEEKPATVSTMPATQVDEPVVEKPALPITDIIKPEPVKEDSVYKNDKKLSDIFKKSTKTSEESNNSVDLEKTVDFNNELDRILKKLNDTSNTPTKDSTLDETTDFSNMF